MPLYDAVKGLDLSVRIQITPSRAIPRSISGVFVDNLKQMADAALDDAVRLARRPVSLWYLPRSNANPTEYYMLDVFLFSQSNVIKYNVAIAHIKQFFLKMKTGVKLTILEALNIKLNFQFWHGVDPRIVRYTDVSNGMVLKPLMENGWSLTIPGPYMAISEINWCFRTVFDRSELDYFRHHIVVKSTGTMVFYDQFDRQHDTIYLCIDLFVEQMRHEEHNHSIKDETAPIDYDSGKYGEITVDSDRGFILTVSMIAIIVLLVILYRVKKALKRKQIEESNRAN